MNLKTYDSQCLDAFTGLFNGLYPGAVLYFFVALINATVGIKMKTYIEKELEDGPLEKRDKEAEKEDEEESEGRGGRTAIN